MKKISGPYWAGVLAFIVMLTASLGMKELRTDRWLGAQNLEATYHVLLTMRVYDTTPVRSHKMLPSVSLSRPNDKHIPWGLSVATADGDDIYTSFGPAGFFTPYLMIKAFGASPTLQNLARVNYSLGAITAALVFAFLIRLGRRLGASEWQVVGGAVGGVAICLFSREAIQSHGVVYWVHSLNQLWLALSLYLLLLLIDVDDARRERWLGSALAVAVFLSAWTEWTGYVFGVGLASLLWVGYKPIRRFRVVAAKVMLATALAGVVTIVHLAWAIGFKTALQSLLGRFLVRAVDSGSAVALLSGYALSYGLFLVLIVVALVLCVARRSPSRLNDATTPTIAFFLIASSIPLIENVVMLQHAQIFSFDRLKFIFPASLIFGMLFWSQGKWVRAVFAGLLVIACINGVGSFIDDQKTYRKWSAIDASNRDLAERVTKSVDADCVIYASADRVRGYASLIFDHGIYENKTRADLPRLMEERSACAAVYLEEFSSVADSPHIMRFSFEPPDLPSYRSATIVRRGKETEEVLQSTP